MQSDEKYICVSAAQALCGVTFIIQQKQSNIKENKSQIYQELLSMKNIYKTRKRCVLLLILKLILAVLTIIYPLFMNIMSGLGMFIEWNDSGIVYNSNKYNSQLALCGWSLIFGGLALTLSAVFCILKKNKISIFTSLAGFILSMASLLKIASHADLAGWSNKYTLEPVSDMYTARILPDVFPFILCIIISIIQIIFFSHHRTMQL